MNLDEVPSVSDPAAPAAEALAADTLSQPVAPLLHTVVLVVVLLVISSASAGTQQQFVDRHGRMTLYLMTIAWEWVVTLYVIWGLRRRRVSLSRIVGGKWSSPEAMLLDVAVAAGFWLVAAGVLAGVGYAVGLRGPGQLEAAKKTLGMLAPHTGAELAVWFALSATAGFCEEIIFRGYLQTQVGALSGSIWVGVLAQAAVFGASHAYEGWQRMIQIAVFGAMFGLLAVWRRSLRPGMLAHALQDSLAGVALRFLK